MGELDKRAGFGGAALERGGGECAVMDGDLGGGRLEMARAAGGLVSSRKSASSAMSLAKLRPRPVGPARDGASLNSKLQTVHNNATIYRRSTAILDVTDAIITKSIKFIPRPTESAARSTTALRDDPAKRRAADRSPPPHSLDCTSYGLRSRRSGPRTRSGPGRRRPAGSVPVADRRSGSSFEPDDRRILVEHVVHADPEVQVVVHREVRRQVDVAARAEACVGRHWTPGLFSCGLAGLASSVTLPK